MESAQMVIGKKQITELSEILHSPRSNVVEMVMWEGVKNLRMKIASEKYVNEEFSLCRAAEFAGVSIQQMARYLAERGISFFRQSIKEVERDAKEAEGWFSNAHSC
ncbi:MAG: UPF0175 family protein [Methanosarcinales archaeon]|nr:UPF0175 family protein [Methanosarcinales archaeon]